MMIKFCVVCLKFATTVIIPTALMCIKAFSNSVFLSNHLDVIK